MEKSISQTRLVLGKFLISTMQHPIQQLGGKLHSINESCAYTLTQLDKHKRIDSKENIENTSLEVSWNILCSNFLQLINFMKSSLILLISPNQANSINILHIRLFKLLMIFENMLRNSTNY
jgi:hypothetical protein